MKGSVPLPEDRVGGSCDRSQQPVIGWWQEHLDTMSDHGWDRMAALGSGLYLVDGPAGLVLRSDQEGTLVPESEEAFPVMGYVPPLGPEQLGDPDFCRDLGIRFPYLAGAMANGIGSVEIVCAMGEAGMLGFFGAAGLRPAHVSQAIERIQATLGSKTYGVNLIHAPQDPQWEEDMVDLLIEKSVHLVEASAYLSLTLPVVRYRVHGIHEDHLGRIVAPNQIIAKVSRVEVASKFFAPPPEKLLQKLVASGHITEHQAQLAGKIPMAQHITAEADSGGHTDNRPALALLPTMNALRDRFQEEHGYPMPLRVGLAGGIATPASAAAAFSMGAAFVLLGSVHQSCVEAGTSDLVRAMLSEARQADTAMAPAADMFEMGVNLQVLKRGTMFAMRAAKLYDYYRKFTSLDDIPQTERNQLERTVFRAPLNEVWQETQAFFRDRDPSQLERAARDPKHKMALVFRYKVLLLNDDYTPMEFVVHVLERIFSKGTEEATKIMLHVHQHGVGVCGVYTYEVAETKVTQVMDFARQHQHPLQCTMEKD